MRRSFPQLPLLPSDFVLHLGLQTQDPPYSQPPARPAYSASGFRSRGLHGFGPVLIRQHPNSNFGSSIDLGYKGRPAPNRELDQTEIVLNPIHDRPGPPRQRICGTRPPASLRFGTRQSQTMEGAQASPR